MSNNPPIITNNNSIKPQNDRFFIDVTETLPTLDQCITFVTHPSCGAISTFSGITRDTFQSKTVSHLSYEGYIPMAIKTLHQLCNEVCNTYPAIYKIAIVHIIGECPISKPSVIIAVSSPHRRDAMHAVEFLIDALKESVPIWKKETYVEENSNGDDGGILTSVWKENVEWKEGKHKRVMVKVVEDSSSS